MTQPEPDSVVSISLDASICIGNGMCCALAPSYFDMEDDGTLHVLRPEVPPGERRHVEAAAAACPVGAISLQI